MSLWRKKREALLYDYRFTAAVFRERPWRHQITSEPFLKVRGGYQGFSAAPGGHLVSTEGARAGLRGGEERGEHGLARGCLGREQALDLAQRFDGKLTKHLRNDTKKKLHIFVLR